MSHLNSWEDDPAAQQDENLSRQAQQQLNVNPAQAQGGFRPGIASFQPGAQSFQPGQPYAGYAPQYQQQQHQYQQQGYYPQYSQQQGYNNQYSQYGGGFSQGYNQGYGSTAYNSPHRIRCANYGQVVVTPSTFSPKASNLLSSPSSLLLPKDPTSITHKTPPWPQIRRRPMPLLPARLSPRPLRKVGPRC